MDDKERLEEIKKHRNDADNSTDEYEFEKINFYNLHVDWLIEQAERANKNAQDLEDMDRQLYSEQQQNKRYREALKNIYELAEYDEYDNTLEQIVLEVEEALEGEK